MVGVISKSLVDIINGLDIGNKGSIQKINQPYILDLVTLQRVFLQGLPLEIGVNNESTFSSIASRSRNVPLFHFAHGEDTISFNISWFANVEEQDDVLTKVKWLASLSKTNGYEKDGVHPVQFSFGKLFKDSKFIVYSAPYRMALFNREKSMLPRLATQEVTLKRISENNPTLNDYKKLSY